MKDAEADGDDCETARLTVRLGALAANYRFLQAKAGPVAAAAVVKADAYGLGAYRAAPALAAAGCGTFFVARLEEGVRLRKVLRTPCIFVLDGATAATAPALAAHRLTPVLNSLAQISAWSAYARGLGALDAAIQIDTGMNRLGLDGPELALLAAEHKTRLANLDLVLLMSHLACADDPGPDAAMNRAQLDRFRVALAMLPPAPASLAASSGIFLGKDYHFDLVRPGIALYGGAPQPGKNPMKTVAVLEGRVLQIRRIDKGESVGYAATFRAKRPTMLATVALGYADGIMRAASNKGAAAFGKARAPYAGRVSMDLLTLDISGLAVAPKVGDLVEVMGDTVMLDELAGFCQTNAYEILNGLSPRIPRRYTDLAS